LTGRHTAQSRFNTAESAWSDKLFPLTAKLTPDALRDINVIAPDVAHPDKPAASTDATAIEITVRRALDALPVASNPSARSIL